MDGEQMVVDSQPVSPIRSLAFALIMDERGRVLLVRHNYGGNYYALPGGAVEPGELPQEAAMREIREELRVEARATRLLSLFSFVADGRFLAHVFLAEIVNGTPTHPGTDEIAEIGWFDPDDLPRPVYVTVEHAIADARRGHYGVLRMFPPAE
jgi:8-oxo-dGTP diphosphatase